MIIVISGPTGVGKTKASIELAKIYNAEIINGDSVQIYKHLDIGSAKVTEAEKENIPHHLFDIKNINEEYTLYNYQKDARNKIEEISKKGKNIIIVGGTGLYIKSVLYDYTLNDSNNTYNQYEDKTTSELYNELITLDKDIEIDRFNRRRIIRAINYYHEFGKSIRENNNGNKLLYDNVFFIGLTVSDRELLYQRINNRVDKMINDGLIDEVKYFFDNKIDGRVLNSAIGYKEIIDYLSGNITKETAIDLIKRNSRRYAKRQYTFFNHQFDMKWFNVDFNCFDKTINEICSYIDKKKDYISRI